MSAKPFRRSRTVSGLGLAALVTGVLTAAGASAAVAVDLPLGRVASVADAVPAVVASSPVLGALTVSPGAGTDTTPITATTVSTGAAKGCAADATGVSVVAVGPGAWGGRGIVLRTPTPAALSGTDFTVAPIDSFAAAAAANGLAVVAGRYDLYVICSTTTGTQVGIFTAPLWFIDATSYTTIHPGPGATPTPVFHGDQATTSTTSSTSTTSTTSMTSTTSTTSATGTTSTTATTSDTDTWTRGTGRWTRGTGTWTRGSATHTGPVATQTQLVVMNVGVHDDEFRYHGHARVTASVLLLALVTPPMAQGPVRFSYTYNGVETPLSVPITARIGYALLPVIGLPTGQQTFQAKFTPLTPDAYSASQSVAVPYGPVSK